MNKIILCADDYGQNRAISEGIVQLAHHKRINAISCLVNTSDWGQTFPELSQLKTTCRIGLHLNLTFGNCLSDAWKKQEGETFPSLSQLLKKAYLRKLYLSTVTAEISAQLQAFSTAMNAPPDFIDGHQHIHQLPVIRNALFSVYSELNLHAPLRSTSHGLRDFFNWKCFPKCQAIALLGGHHFYRQLIRQALPTNTSFAGIYQFQNAKHYRHYFKQFLKMSRDGGLIMCHPGNYSNDQNDPLNQYRHHELDYFMSDVFLKDLEDNSFQLN